MSITGWNGDKINFWQVYDIKLAKAVIPYKPSCMWIECEQTRYFSFFLIKHVSGTDAITVKKKNTTVKYFKEKHTTFGLDAYCLTVCDFKCNNRDQSSE